ncbi:hypothetical protein [Methylorubrum podarium]|uniref:hypothetical protein n=1 Tax=Methylorubrum podarium TaxID=200476 RepID=UPI001EE17567|nr:hypothetical protein [Methylorubrum podarium]
MSNEMSRNPTTAPQAAATSLLRFPCAIRSSALAEFEPNILLIPSRLIRPMGETFQCVAISSLTEIFIVLSWTIKGYFQSFQVACRIATFYWRRPTFQQFTATIGGLRRGVPRFRAMLSKKVA